MTVIVTYKNNIDDYLDSDYIYDLTKWEIKWCLVIPYKDWKLDILEENGKEHKKILDELDEAWLLTPSKEIDETTKIGGAFKTGNEVTSVDRPRLQSKILVYCTHGQHRSLVCGESIAKKFDLKLIHLH